MEGNEAPSTEPGCPVAEAVPAPEVLSSWSTEERSALYKAVDESDYSLADWLEALETFQHWLEGRGDPRRPWRDIVGYIHCCTLMRGAGVASSSLNVLVNQALIDFGFQFLGEAQN